MSLSAHRAVVVNKAGFSPPPSRRTPGVVALLVLALVSSEARAQDGGVPPALVYDTPRKCVDLEPGVFFPQATYAALDAEVRRLQEAGRPEEHPAPGSPLPVVLALLVGIGAGVAGALLLR